MPMLPAFKSQDRLIDVGVIAIARTLIDHVPTLAACETHDWGPVRVTKHPDTTNINTTSASASRSVISPASAYYMSSR